MASIGVIATLLHQDIEKIALARKAAQDFAWQIKAKTRLADPPIAMSLNEIIQAAAEYLAKKDAAIEEATIATWQDNLFRQTFCGYLVELMEEAQPAVMQPLGVGNFRLENCGPSPLRAMFKAWYVLQREKAKGPVFPWSEVKTAEGRQPQSYSEIKDRIDALRELPPNWDTYGSGPITPRALDQAQVVAAILDGTKYLTGIVPVPGGGIQFEFRNAARELEIEVAPDGNVIFLQVDGERAVDEGDVPATEKAIGDLVKWLEDE